MYDGKPLKGIKRAFKTALKEASIQDFRFHDLRHCAATNLRRSNVDTATAMQIVGHKSDKMWKRYNAIEDTDLLNAAKKLNTYHENNTLLTPTLSAGIAASVTT
jgi:integrase